MSATLTNGTGRQAALVECQEHLAAGVSISGTELAKTYGKSSSWGRSVVAEARRTAAPTGPPDAPAPEAPGIDENVVDDVSVWVGRVTVLAVLAVALAAAVASVEHLAALARTAGDTGAKAWLLPASVDGLVVASTMCIYRASKLAQPAGFVPWSSLGLGLAASVVGNVVSVNPDLVDVDHLTIAVGAWPPLALALAFDMALRQHRGAPMTGRRRSMT